MFNLNLVFSEIRTLFLHFKLLYLLCDIFFLFPYALTEFLKQKIFKQIRCLFLELDILGKNKYDAGMTW